MITGVVCPVTPITRMSTPYSTRGYPLNLPLVYKAHNYPWFDLYDEHLPTVHHQGAFSKIRSIATLDSASLPSYDLLDPRAPPNCTWHSGRKAACVSRPCGHPACSECFGESILANRTCVVCQQKVEKHVGFDKPIATVQRGGGSEGTWWEGEAQIQGVLSGSPNVVTLIRAEDLVCRLHGAAETRSVPPPYISWS
jgi:hypothetical protein